MTVQEKNMQDYQELQFKYLEEAEQMFGPKTDYIYRGLSYHNYAPRTILCESSLLTGEHEFKIQLHENVVNDRKNGIFQLSHEVVHLLSPIEQREGNEVNYLEEGLATYFSKYITERETGDYDFCNSAFEENERYLKAYQLYLLLIEIDKDAVQKIRQINPVIANIQHDDFIKAGLTVSSDLIEKLLTKF